jgi:hypothetical protein
VFLDPSFHGGYRHFAISLAGPVMGSSPPLSVCECVWGCGWVGGQAGRGRGGCGHGGMGVRVCVCAVHARSGGRMCVCVCIYRHAWVSGSGLLHHIRPSKETRVSVLALKVPIL